MIGTPFVSKDEQTQRKVDKLNKKPWEQTPTDEKGRKRFHGAFTGGFSAGHFNTCGSKEGWQPTNFISKKEIKAKKQTIFDYMDEEDIKEQIGTHTISTKDNLMDYSSIIKEKNSNLHKIIPGEPPSELYLQFNNAIGHKLMIEAGFDQQQRNKKVYGCVKVSENSTSDSNLYYKGKLEFKDNYFGIGYTMTVDELFDNKKNEEEISNKNRIHMSIFSEDTALAFYDNKDKSKYSFEEIGIEDDDVNFKNKAFDFRKKADRPIDNNYHTGISFVKSRTILKVSDDIINYEKPVLPESYDPFNKNKDIKIVVPPIVKTTNYGKLNPEKRSLLINEKFHTEEKKIEEKSSKIIENSTKYEFKINIPFKEDLAKLSRFSKYIAEKEGLFISEEYFANSNMMTASQIREEKLLFAKLFDDEMKTRRAEEYLQKEIKNDDVSKNTDELKIEEKIEKLKDKLSKRDKCKWIPNKLLCKRFKIKDPFEHSVQFENINNKLSDKKSKFERGDDLNNSMGVLHGLNSVQKNAIKDEEKQTTPSFIKNLNNEKNKQIIINSTSNTSIFDQIFGDD